MTRTAAAAEPPSVRDFLADGYRITDKQVEDLSLAGAPPYQDLRRLVHITTYRLVRNSETITCRVSYDSQQDRLDVTCQ